VKWTTVVPAGAALGLLVVLVLPAWRPAPPANPAPSAVPVPAAPAAGTKGETGPAWLSGLGDTQALPVAAPAEPLAQRIERLAASGDPHDAFQAWWLLHACVVFERTGRLPARDGRDREVPADPAHACATLNERSKMARIDHLERAARARVDGALGELVEEGPFGDPTALATRPDDPLVKEWKARVNGMLNDQAEQGDWSSLYHVFTGFLFGHPAIAADRQSALAYGMALRDIMVKLDGVPEQQAIPFNGPFLDGIGAGLTPTEKAWAQARADAIVARAADQRGRSGPEIANPISIARKK
jgi:hypothetical protein